jgi:hypothetical protein
MKITAIQHATANHNHAVLAYDAAAVTAITAPVSGR